MNGGTCALTCSAGYTKSGDAVCTAGTWSTQSCSLDAGVPTLSEWGRIVFSCLALAFVLWQARRRLGAP